MLEKKQDYLERARDFHKKDKTLQVLRRKAEERNPDEFYFAMQNAKTKDGVHVVNSAQANKYSQAELRLMKTQDAAYVRLKAQADAKKADRLQESLHFIGAPQQAKHTVFVESQEERAAFDPAQHFDTPAALLERAYNRPRRAQLEAETGGLAAAAEAAAALTTRAARAQRAAASSYRQLTQRVERGAKLSEMATKMELEKQLMGKGRKTKRKVELEGEDGRPAKQTVYRWKQERKR